MTDLTTQRAALAQEDRRTYRPSAFPGSREWRVNKQARDALKAFDAAHPEIAAARIEAPLTEGAARALRGED